MKRDMDLIRDLMLKFEAGELRHEIRSDASSQALCAPLLGISEEEEQKLEYHFYLLEDAKYVNLHRNPDGLITVQKITNAGHDFIDSVRDPKVWKMTKEGAVKAGGFTLEFLGSISKSIARKQFEKLTGLEL